VSDDFDALFGEDPRDESMAAAVAEDGGAPADPSKLLARLMGAFDLGAVSGSSLAARGKLVEMHEQLREVEEFVSSRRRAIELAFVRAGAEQGADEIRTSAGVVKLKLPPGKYETKANELRQALIKLEAEGLISKYELEAASPVTVSYGANHTQLNKLARHRGEKVASVIDAHRVKVDPDPTQAKPQFPKLPAPPKEDR
jgi:hypothetical protein